MLRHRLCLRTDCMESDGPTCSIRLRILNSAIRVTTRTCCGLRPAAPLAAALAAGGSFAAAALPAAPFSFRSLPAGALPAAAGFLPSALYGSEGLGAGAAWKEGDGRAEVVGRLKVFRAPPCSGHADDFE